MKKFQIAVAALMLVAVFAAPASALAAPVTPAPAFEDVIIFGDDYTLAAGQTVQGSLVVFGGSVVVETGAEVTGEVIVFGGSVDLAGHVEGSTVLFGGDLTQAAAAVNNSEIVVFGGGVNMAGHVGGDLVVFGGDVNLASTAVVEGDLATPGGDVERASGAVVNGNVVDDFQFDFPRDRVAPVAPIAPNLPMRLDDHDWGGVSAVWLLFRAFAMSTVALLVVLFAPTQLRRVADAVMADPIVSGGYGLLTTIVAVVAMIGLTVTLILIPVAILVPFVLVFAWAFGWIALGMEVGCRMAEALKATWSPALEAMFGTFTLTFVAGVIGWVPCIGGLAGFVFGAAGLGAVVLTRFGGQNHVPAVRNVAPPAAQLPAPKPRKRTTKK